MELVRISCYKRTDGPPQGHADARRSLVAALAAALTLVLASAPEAQARPSARFDCGTRVLAVVFLPHKALLDVGDGSHRRILLADASSYEYRKGCRRVPNLVARWGGGPRVTTVSETKLGCVFPRPVQLEVLPLLDRAGRRLGVQVFAAPRASVRALLYATLTKRRSHLAFDTRYCRPL